MGVTPRKTDGFKVRRLLRQILRPHLEAFVLILPDDRGEMIQKLRRDLASGQLTADAVAFVARAE